MTEKTHPPRIDYRTRVTVDIDHYVPTPRIRLLRAYYNMLNAGATEVKVAVSSSRRGYHVEGLFAEKFDEEQQEKMRRNLSDDANRIYMDRERSYHGHTDNVMWHSKSTNEYVRQRFETPEDAIDYVSETRKGDPQRVKAIANYGHKAITDSSMPRPSNVENDSK